MYSFKSLLFLMVLIACYGDSFSQTSVPLNSDVSNYLGKWTYNAKESFKGQSDRKLYTAYVISIERVEDKLRITREYVYNSIAFSREDVIYLDGRGETNSLVDSSGKASIVRLSKSRLKNGSIFREFPSETGSGPPDTETLRISDDGTRLIVERRYKLKFIGWEPQRLMDRVGSDRLVLER